MTMEYEIQWALGEGGGKLVLNEFLDDFELHSFTLSKMVILRGGLCD